MVSLTFAPDPYEIRKLKPEEGMKVLREIFPTGEANDMNFCLFSTSGVHGSYLTIEEIEAELRARRPRTPNRLTVLVIMPRVVRMLYGNIDVTLDDIPWLKQLRRSSREVLKDL